MEDNDTITLKELLEVIDSVSCEDCWENRKSAYVYSNELKNKLKRIDVKKEYPPSTPQERKQEST